MPARAYPHNEGRLDNLFSPLADLWFCSIPQSNHIVFVPPQYEGADHYCKGDELLIGPQDGR